MITDDGGSMVTEKFPKKLNLQQWKGKCKCSFQELGYSSVGEFINDVRGQVSFPIDPTSESCKAT
jgi:hypothetical protein